MRHFTEHPGLLRRALQTQRLHLLMASCLDAALLQVAPAHCVKGCTEHSCWASCKDGHATQACMLQDVATMHASCN